MKAKKKPVHNKTLADIGLSHEEFGPEPIKTKIISLAYPPKRNAGKVVIEGNTVEEKAAQLVKLLQDKAVVS